MYCGYRTPKIQPTAVATGPRLGPPFVTNSAIGLGSHAPTKDALEPKGRHVPRGCWVRATGP